MKLEVGMYCRYNGRIGKIKYICDCEQCKARGYLEPVIEYIHKEDEYVSCYYKNDLKASHNIIDLIEVGDYVNGCYIQEIKSLKNNVMVCMLDSDYEFLSTITNKEIKTIVTHEQMEQMAYKVGE